jgi:hypothetical protein
MCRRMTDEETGSDVDRGVRDLGPDIEAVRRWGQHHHRAFVSLKIDRSPSVMVSVLLWGDDVANHEAALRAVVPHPESLRVETSHYDPSYLDQVQAELRESARTEQGAIRGHGPGWGTVQARLRADQEALAARLHTRYGSAVTLTLGNFPYPGGRPLTWTERRPRGSPSSAAEEVIVDGLDARPEFLTDRVVAGRDGHGRVLLTNVGTTPLDLRTDQPLVAVVLAPSTGEEVGGYTGMVAGTGLGLHLGAGEKASVAVIFGTASLRPTLGFALPAGMYLVRAEVPLHETPPRPAGTRGVIPVPPAELTVL